MLNIACQRNISEQVWSNKALFASFLVCFCRWKNWGIWLSKYHCGARYVCHVPKLCSPLARIRASIICMILCATLWNMRLPYYVQYFGSVEFMALVPFTHVDFKLHLNSSIDAKQLDCISLSRSAEFISVSLSLPPSNSMKNSLKRFKWVSKAVQAS